MNTISESLLQALKALTGLTCSEVVAGIGVGTNFSLSFGPVVRMETITTPKGPREREVFDWAVFVQNTTWRLENASRVICSSTADSNGPDSALYLGLNGLLCSKVQIANVSHTGLDLTIEFDNGNRLLVFSVALYDPNEDHNYTVFTPSQAISVTFDGSINCEPRNAE